MGLSRLQIGVLAQKWQPVFSKTPSIYIILEQISLSNKMVTLVKIMDITQVNYTIAKNVVNNLPALLPIVVEDKQIAQAIKTKLENLGATVSLKENHVRRSSQ